MYSREWGPGRHRNRDTKEEEEERSVSNESLKVLFLYFKRKKNSCLEKIESFQLQLFKTSLFSIIKSILNVYLGFSSRLNSIPRMFGAGIFPQEPVIDAVFVIDAQARQAGDLIAWKNKTMRISALFLN